jgi:hypothetical protein
MSFIITGTGKRRARSYEASTTAAPKLIVSYSAPATTATEEDFESKTSVVEEASLLNDGIQVSPNPVVDRVSLEFGQEMKGRTVSYAFISSSGQNALSAVGKLDDAGTVDVDLRSLPPGFYVVRVVSGRGSSAYKILKQ